MQLLIWGAGAIGGTLGAFLAQAGHDVTFVDSASEHVAAINQQGIRITGPIDEFQYRVPAFKTDELSGQYETVLLCVKSQHTQAATNALMPHLKAGGCVVSVQNGLNELIIRDIVGYERTIGAFVNFGADYIEPGLVHFGGRGAVVLGEIDGQLTPRLGSLHRTFLDFDPNAITTTNIWGYLWSKEAYGAMLFITALTNESIADALAAREYRTLYIAIVREILGVAQVLGIQPEAFNGFNPFAFMPGAAPDLSDQSMDEMVAFNRLSAKTHSGIWRDLAIRKRPTEVNMYDLVMREGQRAGVSMPITQRMVTMIHEIEDDRRPLSLGNLDELRASMA